MSGEEAMQQLIDRMRELERGFHEQGQRIGQLTEGVSNLKDSIDSIKEGMDRCFSRCQGSFDETEQRMNTSVENISARIQKAEENLVDTQKKYDRIITVVLVLWALLQFAWPIFEHYTKHS